MGDLVIPHAGSGRPLGSGGFFAINAPSRSAVRPAKVPYMERDSLIHWVAAGSWSLEDSRDRPSLSLRDASDNSGEMTLIGAGIC